MSHVAHRWPRRRQTDPIAEAVDARGRPRPSSSSATRRAARARPSRTPVEPPALKADAEAAGIDLYVHAPYPLNVASTNNRIRIPSRKLLQQYLNAAAEIGAKGVIVHGGHVLQGRRPRRGLRQLAQVHRRPGHAGPAADREHRRRRQRDGPPAGADRGLWEAIGRAKGGDTVGFCLDTCHAHAGGKELATVVERVQGDHRADRPGARQRLPRRVRLRRRPARQLRRPVTSSGRRPGRRWSARRTLRSSARRPAAPRARAPTSPGCVSRSTDR